MDSKELRGLVEAYSEVYAPQEEIEEAVKGEPSERRASLASERKSGIKPLPAKEGEKYASHKLAQMAYSKRKRMGEEVEQLDEVSKTDDGTRASIKMFAGKKGIEFEPGPRWDPSANRGKGANLSPKQMEKQRRKKLRQEDVDIFDVVLEFLQSEGYAETLEEAEWLMANVIDEEAIGIILEITGGKGHPGYKAGSKDHGPMQSGHPADSRKRQVKGGTMSQRHGYHLGDIDDDDDDEDELETIVKQQSRDSRERVRKPLRNKVRSARKVLSKEEYMDEAQAARENPEKYEREASKTQPRGEQLKRKLDDKRKTNKSLDDMMKAYGF